MIYPISKGLGDSPLNISMPQIGSTVIGAGAPIATSAILGTSLAVPVIGAAVAGVTLLIGGWLSSIAKHNAEKTAATAIVNQAEPYLKQNLAAFQSIQNPTLAEQQQALANFDNIWAQVVQACSNANLEDAGKRCISDREPGGQWNWFGYYRDPIANTVIAPPPPATTNVSTSNVVATVTSSVSNVVSTVTSNPIYLGLAGVGLLILLFSGGE